MGRSIVDLDPAPLGWRPEPLELPLDAPSPVRPPRQRGDDDVNGDDAGRPPGSVVIVIELA